MCVPLSEVSSFQRLKRMKEWYLWLEKVSCLERCPQFRQECPYREREVPVVLCVFLLLLCRCGGERSTNTNG